MKKLISKVLSIITAFVMIFLSITPTITTAFAAETDTQDKTATPDTPESSLFEQTLTATIYSSKWYRKVLSSDTTEITLTGNMPDGAVVKAYPVDYELAASERSDEPRQNDESEVSGEVLLSYDITIFDGKKEFEPDGDTISVTFKSPEIEKFADDELSVIHVKDDGEEEVIGKSTDNSSDELTIETDGFSVFVIVKHENGEVITPRVVYHYLTKGTEIEGSNGLYTSNRYYFNTKAENPSVQVCTQIVKNGEELDLVPTPPDMGETHFNGWYIIDVQDAGGNNAAAASTGPVTYSWPSDPIRQVFSEPVEIFSHGETADGLTIHWATGSREFSAVADSTGAVHVFLAPLYVNYRYVNFFDADNILIARKLLVLDSNNRAKMLISDMSADNLEGDLYFMGWSTEPFVNTEQTHLPNPQISDPENPNCNTIPLYEEGYKHVVYITLYQTANNEIRIFAKGSKDEVVHVDTDPYYTALPTESGNVNLYAEYEKAHWLQFVAGETGWGSMYVPADYLLGNTPAFRLPETSRPGYKFDGWCLGKQSATGAISYLNADGQGYTVASEAVGEPSDYYMITKGEDDAYTDVDKVPVVSGNKTYTVNGNTVLEIRNGKLITYDHITLFAKWSPKNDTKITVVAWRQKVSDDKNAADSDKKYDYYDSVTIDASTSRRINEITTEQWGLADKLFHLDDSTNQAAYDEQFARFHRRQLLDSEINIYPDPQGTSVVNVYYDRDLITLNFYTNSSRNYYQETQSNSGTQYGIVNGEFVQLTYTGGKWYAPKYDWIYTQNADGLYTQVDGKWVLLTKEIDTQTITYKYTKTNYSITQTTNTSNGQYYYYLPNGTDTYIQAYKWYSNTSWYQERYTATTDKGSTLFAKVEYDSSHYIYVPLTRNGNNNNSYYYTLPNGEVYTGTRYSRTDQWNGTQLNNAPSPVYSLSNSGTVMVYNGDSFYTRSTGETFVSASGDDNNIYAFLSEENMYVPLTKETVTTYKYTYNGVDYSSNTRYTRAWGEVQGETVEYTGTRYTYVTTGNTNAWHLYRQFTGLYGSTLESNHYIWPTTYDWHESYSGNSASGTRTTFLDAFIIPDGSVTKNFYAATSTTGKTVNFYKEALDGSYVLANSVGTSGNGTFTITDKYDGFHAYQYSTNGTSWTSAGQKKPNGDYVSGISYSSVLYIRFARNSGYKLTFDPNYPGAATFAAGESASERESIEGFKYESPLAGYNDWPCPFTVPEHYSFDGWYADKACTKRFDFVNEIMPDGNMIVFAKWYPDWYLIQIDPNGGTLAGDNGPNQSSYFWLQYGTAIGKYNIEREYMASESETVTTVEQMTDQTEQAKYYRYRSVYFSGWEHSETYYNTNGTRYYGFYNVDPSNDTERVANQDFEGIKPSQYRQAEYIKVTDFRTSNDTFFTMLVDGFTTYIGKHPELYPELTTPVLIENKANELAAEWDDRYTTDQKAYTKINTSDPNAVTWVLTGWDKVTQELDEHGNVIGETLEPYNFIDEVTDKVTLRAQWRQSGKFIVVYHSHSVGSSNGSAVGVLGTFPNEGTAHYDPKDPNEIYNSEVAEGYADGADAPAYIAPLNPHGPADDGNVYIFEGWRIVHWETIDNISYAYPIDRYGNRITDDDEDRRTNRFQQGDIFYIHHEQISENGYIHLEPVYRIQGQTVRNPDVVQLVLNPSRGYGGSLDVNATNQWPAWTSPGQRSVAADNDGTNTTDAIIFRNIQNNGEIHLSDYIPYFKHEQGFFLLGFDEEPNPMRLDKAYIPKYPADAVIGVDKLPTNTVNRLYAIWEPMVYATFVNETGAGITIDISESDQTQVILVNDATQTYDRSRIEDHQSITVGAGKTLRMVIPDGARPEGSDPPFQSLNLVIDFENNHPGFLMNATVYDPRPDTTETLVTDLGYKVHWKQVPSGDDVEERTKTLFFHADGYTYTFTERALDEAIFDVNGGRWEDSYSGDQYKFNNANYHSPDASSKFVHSAQKNDEFKIRTEDFMALTTTPKPAKPTPPSNRYKFIGWTVEETLSKITDYSLLDNQVESITDPNITAADKTWLNDLFANYKRRFLIDANTRVTLYDVVVATCIQDFNAAVGGCKFYALYAETVDIVYHLAAFSGSKTNHTWNTDNDTELYDSDTDYTETTASGGDGREHTIYTRHAIKGRTIDRPFNPKHYNNTDYHFYYWVEDDKTNTVNPVTANITPFDFSQPITRSAHLYTTWTDRHLVQVKLKKVLSGTYKAVDKIEDFEFTIKVTTYRYSVYNTIVTREVSEEYPVKTTARTLRPVVNSNNEYVAEEMIDLFHWTSGNYFYEQQLEVVENKIYANEDYDTHVELETASNVDNHGKLTQSENRVIYDPFYCVEHGFNHVRSMYYSGGTPIWIYYTHSNTSSGATYYFNDNKWFTTYNSNNGGSLSGEITTGTKAPDELSQTVITYNNTRNLRIRFVKIQEEDENGVVRRINGGSFTLERVEMTSGSNYNTIPNAKLNLTAATYKTQEDKTAGRVGERGRMIVPVGYDFSDENGSMHYDPDEAEVEFLKEGTYILTEVTPPDGYQDPSVAYHNNKLKIVVSKTGIESVTDLEANPVSGGNNLFYTYQRLVQWNSFEALSLENEYAVVIQDSPVFVNIRVENVRLNGEIINAPNNAVFNVTGTTSQTSQVVSETYTVPDGTFSVYKKHLGTFTLAQTVAPTSDFKLAMDTTIQIVSTGVGQVGVTASGDNVVPNESGNLVTYDSQNAQYVIRILNVMDGYNLRLIKTVIGTDEPDTNTYTFTVTASNAAEMQGKEFMWSKKGQNDADFTMQPQSVEFANGVLTFDNISDGDQILIVALPKNAEFTVREVNGNEYHASYLATRESGPASVGTHVQGGVSLVLSENSVVEVTNDLTVLPAPTAVAQVAGTAFAELLMLCILGAGIYFVLSKRRKEVGCDAI